MLYLLHRAEGEEVRLFKGTWYKSGMGKLIRFLLTPWRRYRERRAWKKIASGMVGMISQPSRKWFSLDRDE